MMRPTIHSVPRPRPWAWFLAAALALAAAPAAARQSDAARALPSVAQAPASVGQSPASVAAPTRNPMHANLASQYRIIRLWLTRAAEAMPDDRYDFRPTGDMRPFVANVVHAAASNYGYCANLRHVKSPVAAAALESSITTKPEAIRVLAESFAFCDPFVEGLTDNAALTATYQATRRAPDGTTAAIDIEVGGLFSNYLAHQNEVYGYTAVYLRLQGIVPPTSVSRSRPPGGSPTPAGRR